MEAIEGEPPVNVARHDHERFADELAADRGTWRKVASGPAHAMHSLATKYRGPSRPKAYGDLPIDFVARGDGYGSGTATIYARCRPLKPFPEPEPPIDETA